jgi:hypothetical protein
MGQIFRLQLSPTAYPDASANLGTAECVLLLAVRWWVCAFRLNDDPMPRLRQTLASAGTADAAFAVDALMAVVSQSARRPIEIHGPRCTRLANDEKCLLHAASLAQGGDPARAERALHTALLSAQGVEFALGSLEGLGALFARARLLLRRRLPPDHGAPAAAAIESWSPDLFSDTIH